MLVIALLLAVVAAGLGFYAQANNSHQDFTIFGATWHTYTWVPAAIAAGAVALVCLAALVWSMLRIRRLRRANAALHNDINLYMLERATAAATPRARAEEPARELVGRDASPGSRGEPVLEPSRDRSDAEHLQIFPVEAGNSR